MAKAYEQDPNFEALLNYLKRARAFDFTGYKRTSLQRRIQRRIQTINVESFADYIDYLEVHPDEFGQLFNTILINVTNFFRDPAAWDYIASDIIPQILSSKRAEDPIRIWSAGCASGEEAYTIAMYLAEALGVGHFRERVKIYASDVDEDALVQGRQATYTTRQVNNIPPPLLEKYFERIDQRYTFRKDLRRAVIFGRHDLVQDAPISRIDLLICRNVIMYFNAETQSKILSRFHFAVNETGFLFLGKAEMLFTHAALFQPVDLRRRVFKKVPRITLRDRLLSMTDPDDDDNDIRFTEQIRFRDAAFDASIVAQVVVDTQGFVVLANERARTLLGITLKDLPRSLFEFEMVFRIPELRSKVESVSAERLPTVLKDIEWNMQSGEIRTLEVQLSPLFDGSSTFLGVSITFADVTQYHRLQAEVERSNQELETAYEELQSTNEELETTNEELQSTVEELETTNEELQSTNEELETMNEELQSANEELQTINEELRRRTDELNQLNGFMGSILTSIRGAVVVLDRELRVQVWSPKAEDLWGLRANEAEDRNFLYLDFGLPVNELVSTIRSCLAQERDYDVVMLKAINRRGKPIQCKVTCSPLLNSSNEHVRGVILVMEDQEELAQGNLQAPPSA